METSGIDETRRIPKTKQVTHEERTRLGRKLRALRTEHGWDQKGVAKRAGISVGTVQTIERNKRNALVENLEKYANAVESSVQALLYGDAPPAPPPRDPLLADLNREHLRIARAYMRGLQAQRQAVDLILLGEDEDLTDDLATIVLLVGRGARDVSAQAPYWTRLVLERGDLIILLGQRLNRDHTFEDSLRDQLTALAAYPDPPAPAPSRRARDRQEKP